MFKSTTYPDLWISHSRGDWGDIAAHMVGSGYVPFSPHGGRHIMDDFGNLVQSLPKNMPPGWDCWDILRMVWWGCDLTYACH